MRIHFRQWSMILCCLMPLLFIAACAPAGGSASGGNSNPTATPAPGSPELNGCPTQQPPAGVAERPADVVVEPGGSPIDGMQVTLSKGQTLEVRLSATVRWGLMIQGDQTMLMAPTPNGWYDASTKSCVWRFRAVGTGTVILSYSGGQVCEPNSACPAIAAVQQYTVTIQ
jgi:hypothetical protein